MNEDDDSRRAEDADARWSRAAMESLDVEAPADLKARLKSMARARPPEPSIWDGLREALSGGAWAYGAGAAFAAATVALALWNAIPAAGPLSGDSLALAPVAPVTLPVDAAVAAVAPVTPVASVAADLAGLWTDDDGEDHDEG